MECCSIRRVEYQQNMRSLEKMTKKGRGTFFFLRSMGFGGCSNESPYGTCMVDCSLCCNFTLRCDRWGHPFRNRYEKIKCMKAQGASAARVSVNNTGRQC